MSVRQTPISYLNAQIGEIAGLSTSLSTLTGNFDYFSTVTVPEISTSINQLISSSIANIPAISTAAGFAVSTANTVQSNFSTFAERQSTFNGNLAVVSTTVSTLINENLNTSTSISTLTSSVTAAITAAIGGAALSTAFYLPLTGFSTVYGRNFSTINSTLNYISTIDAQQASTINVISTIDGQQASTINTISTLAGQAISTVNVVSTIAGQSASTVNAQSTINGEQTSNISNLAASTTILQYGARPAQAFNGVYTDADWSDGTDSRKTSTIINFQAGLTASGSGVIGTSNSVSLINNTNTSTTMFPLMIGVSGQGIPAYPASANQILRFAHSGAPGSNSSIIINLTTGGTASDAIEMNAGEVITLVYAGGGNTDPANYYYFPTL
jgi:hypothetical protein